MKNQGKKIFIFFCLVNHKKIKKINKNKSQGKMERKQNQQFVLDDYQFVE